MKYRFSIFAGVIIDSDVRKVKLIFILILNLIVLTAAAQTGSIAGTVTDVKFKEPLIGATILVQGTSNGVITDLDGNFRLEKLQPGTYTLVVSYISYQTQTIPDVEVIAGQEALLTVELSDASMELQHVVVVAQRRLGTEMAVLNTVRKSLPVVNGISSQQITKTQDTDAAEVLRRIPGLTIQDERFVVVRGLGQRYNGVWLNNATTPSSETDSRAFSFDVLPSFLIDNIMIYKSPSAELPADFAGGFVKVLTKNIPEGSDWHISYQAGFNTNSSFRSFKLAEGSGLDFLGAGAGKRQLPSSFPDDLTELTREDAAGYSREVNDRWGVRSFTAIPEQKVNLTYNKLFELDKVRIGNITNINYSTGYDYYESVNRNYLSYNLMEDRSSYRYDFDDVQYKNTTKLGALMNWSVLWGNHKMEFRNFVNQRATNSLTQREGTDYYSEEYIRKWESLYTARTTYSGQLSGEHIFRPDINKFTWTGGYSYAGYNEPDRKVVKLNQITLDGESNFMVSDPARYYQQLKDHSFSFSADYDHTFRVKGLLTPAIRTGVYGEKKSRDFNACRFVYAMLGSGYNRYAEWDFTDVFSEENLAADKIFMRETTNKSDNYTSDNVLGAGYVSARLNWADKLNVYAGARLEHYRIKVDGFQPDGVKEVNVKKDFTDLFPSVNVAYNFDEKHLLRAGYGQTINRAEFREIVPYSYYDFGMEANIMGNEDIRNAYIRNVDVRYEFYPSPSETVSLGFFYKYFDDPIEQTFSETGSGLEYTFTNAGSAKSYGLEMEAKKNLGFMGMNYLNLVLNGAYIHSKVYFDEGLRRDRPMYGQSPYMINTGLFYQSEDNDMSGSILYNRIGKRIETVGIPKQNSNEDIPDIYEMPRNSLDLSFSKKFGKYVEMKLGVKDLLNSKIEYKQTLKLDEKAGNKDVDQVIRSYRPGVKINLAVSIRF